MSSYRFLLDEISISSNSKKVSIFCGSGISLNSGVPTVDHIYKELERCFDISNQEFASIVNERPFEAVMQCIISIKDDTFLETFGTILNSAEPNTNHFFLANALVNKKIDSIITTNFDELIEKAIDQLGDSFCEAKTKIQKLHGTISLPNEMAITIDKVASKSISKIIEPILKDHLIQKNIQTVIFLGYSFQDKFDIIPILKSLPKTFKIIVVDHHDKFYGVERSTKFGFECYTIRDHTDNFVKEISKLLLGKYMAVDAMSLNYKSYFNQFRDYINDYLGHKKFEYLYQLHLNVNSEQTLSYGIQAFESAKKCGMIKWAVVMAGNIAQNYYSNFSKTGNLTDLKQSLNYIDYAEENTFFSSIQQCINVIYENPKKIEDLQEELIDYVNIIGAKGRIIKHQSMSDAEAIFTQLIELSSLMNDTFTVIVHYSNLAKIKFLEGNLDESIRIYNEAIKISPVKDSMLNMQLFLGLKNCYLAKKDFDSAHKYLKKAQDVNLRLGLNYPYF